MFFKPKSLDTILSAFDRIANDLSAHLNTKVEEKFTLLSNKTDIEQSITSVDQEIDRAHRVLTKVSELVA